MLDSVLHAQGIYDCEQKQKKKKFSTLMEITFKRWKRESQKNKQENFTFKHSEETKTG